MLYHLVEGKTADKGKVVMTDSLSKVNNRLATLRQSSAKKGVYKRGPFWVVEACDETVKYYQKPKHHW